MITREAVERQKYEVRYLLPDLDKNTEYRRACRALQENRLQDASIIFERIQDRHTAEKMGEN